MNILANKLIVGKFYRTVGNTIARVGNKFYVIPTKQELIFKKIVKRNKVSNWFVFIWKGKIVKLTELSISRGTIVE